MTSGGSITSAFFGLLWSLNCSRDFFLETNFAFVSQGFALQMLLSAEFKGLDNNVVNSHYAEMFWRPAAQWMVSAL